MNNTMKYVSMSLVVMGLMSCTEKKDSIPENNPLANVEIVNNGVGEIVISYNDLNDITEDLPNHVFYRLLIGDKSLEHPSGKFHGYVKKGDRGLFIQKLDSNEKWYYTVDPDDYSGQLVDGIGMNITGDIKDLSFMKPNMTFYQSHYIYKSKLKGVEPDIEHLNSLRMKTQ